MTEEDLFGVMAVVEENAKTADDSYKKITQAAAKLELQTAALATILHSAASRGVKESLAEAPAAAEATLNCATKSLDDAVVELQKSSAWLGWRLCAIVAVVCMSIVFATYGLALYMLPSAETIAEKRREVAELDAAIADRARRGGRIKLETCGNKGTGRLCVRVDQSAGIFGKENDPHMVVQGY